MKISSAKNKARKLQQWVVAQLLTRNEQLEKDDVRSTPMGVTGEDVQLSPAARKLIPLQIECKARAKFAGYEFFEQAKTFGDYTPVVVIKANGKKPLVLLDAEDFFNIITKGKE